MTTPLVPDPPIAQGVWGPARDNNPDIIPEYDKLVVEDGKPADNLFVERQYRLLTEPLHTCWSGPGEGRSFLAMANVGWFYAAKQSPLVPDCMLILDVKARPPREKEGRSYFQWVYGKPPDVVIEIVSDTLGGEDDVKMRAYARMGAPYYVIFDPDERLKAGVLRAFSRTATGYEPTNARWFAGVGLGLVLWKGPFQGVEDTWLRWCDKDGNVIPTGAERAEEAEARAESAEAR